MMNATERATRTQQAHHAKNTAVLQEIEPLMDAATENGENTLSYPTVIHGDAVEELEAAGYKVSLNNYSGTFIVW